MTWVRNELGRSGDKDAARSNESISFLVSGGYSPAQVLANPAAILGGDSGAEPLPAIGSVHPEIPGLKLDRYSVTGNGATLEAVAYYTTDGSGRIPPPQLPLEFGKARFRSRNATLSFDLPYQRARTVLFELPPGGTGGPNDPEGWRSVQIWAGEADNAPWSVRTIHMEYRIHTTRAVIKSEDYAAANEALDANQNKCHLINGRLYQFSGGDLDPQDGSEFHEIDLTWWSDPGWDLALGGTTSPGGYNFPNPQVGLLDGTTTVPRTRPPFHIIQPLIVDTTDNPRDPADPIDFEVIPIAEVRVNGHLELLGYVEGWT